MSYLTFSAAGTSKSGITRQWHVIGSDHTLIGRVRWHGPWRKYIFTPIGEPIFDPGCLVEIAEFIEKYTQDHRTSRIEVGKVIW